MTNTVGERVRHSWRSSTGLRAAARFGLGSRALVYLTLTVLVVQLSVGDRSDNTDQGSGIKALGENPVGMVALVALVVGVVCYASWRLLIALTSQSRGRERVLAAVEGLAYVPFGYMAIGVLTGDTAAAAQGPRYRSLSARVMEHTAGRWLVVVVGVVIVIVGAFLASQGLRASFMKNLYLPARPVLVRAVRTVGAVGSTGRGAVFVLAGALVIYAGVTGRPSKSGGVDAAFDAVRSFPGGRYILFVVALALLCFALLTLAESIWRQITPNGATPTSGPAPTDPAPNDPARPVRAARGIRRQARSR